MRYQIEEIGNKSLLMAHKLFNELYRRRHILEISPYAINLGCGDGISYNDPCYALYISGFSGIAIDAQSDFRLTDNLGKLSIDLLSGVIISTKNICQILHKYKCPSNPSFLKIDLDGIDAAIIQSILNGNYRPYVIQAEINPEIPPPYAFSVKESDFFYPGFGHGFYGFSLAYGVDLLNKYGYTLIQLDFETEYTHDGLWLRNDLINSLGIIPMHPFDIFLSKKPALYHIDAIDKGRLMSWRDRNDFENVLFEISNTLHECAFRKHGNRYAQFELYISDYPPHEINTRMG